MMECIVRTEIVDYLLFRIKILQVQSVPDTGKKIIWDVAPGLCGRQLLQHISDQVSWVGHVEAAQDELVPGLTNLAVPHELQPLSLVFPLCQRAPLKVTNITEQLQTGKLTL